MSHFTAVRTQMVEPALIKAALTDLGYDPVEGDVRVRGFAGRQTPAQIKVATANPIYDIGFVRAGDRFEVVADWYGIREVTQEDFVARLARRYAYHAARAKLEEQGFALVSEEQGEGGEVRLVLRRLA